MKDTIAAIATPAGKGAIGIVRIGGDAALDVLNKVWISAYQSVDKFVTHRLYLGNIVDLSTGKEVDRVLVSYMKAPRSYTGEDIVEISCHGGPVVLKKVLEQVLSAGARPAEPGEFTKRAFLNGKLDLVQAEGVAALIDSRSALSARLAEEQLSGRLSCTIGDLKDRLKEMLSFVEATIDFPEEDIEFIEDARLQDGLAKIDDDLTQLVKSFDKGRVIRSGVKVVIAGPPNAGKSSLLNALLGCDRAIVHHIPGTTRDTIEEEVILDGISFRLVDTAGIREAEEEVEEIGVEKSRHEMISAEAILLVLDGHDYTALDEKFLEELRDVKHVIVIVNKKDLGLSVDKELLGKRFVGRSIIEISASTGSGVNELVSRLVGEMVDIDEISETEGIIITSERHFRLVKSCKNMLEKAILGIEKRESSEFIALNLRVALDNLGQIVGEVTTDEILNEIFSKFCIGK